MGMSSSGGGSAKGRSVPVINVTPLVDVVLVVLIIFMIVTMNMTKTFFVNVPPKDDKEEPPTAATDVKPVVMTVDKAGVIRVNQAVVPKNEIAARVPRMLAGANQRVLYFDAHDETDYGTAIEAMDLSRGSGVRSIAILTAKVVK
jgi:biopolymer transport protein ExbD/biopolymer transport protein TolR